MFCSYFSGCYIFGYKDIWTYKQAPRYTKKIQRSRKTRIQGTAKNSMARPKKFLVRPFLLKNVSPCFWPVLIYAGPHARGLSLYNFLWIPTGTCGLDTRAQRMSQVTISVWCRRVQKSLGPETAARFSFLYRGVSKKIKLKMIIFVIVSFWPLISAIFFFRFVKTKI